MQNKEVIIEYGGKGIGLPTLLTIVFLILKLTNTIDWNWIWVFSPLWGYILLWIAIIVVAVFIAIIVKLVDEIKGSL